MPSMMPSRHRQTGWSQARARTGKRAAAPPEPFPSRVAVRAVFRTGAGEPVHRRRRLCEELRAPGLEGSGVCTAVAAHTHVRMLKKSTNKHMDLHALNK